MLSVPDSRWDCEGLGKRRHPHHGYPSKDATEINNLGQLALTNARATANVIAAVRQMIAQWELGCLVLYSAATAVPDRFAAFLDVSSLNLAVLWDRLFR